MEPTKKTMSACGFVMSDFVGSQLTHNSCARFLDEADVEEIRKEQLPEPSDLSEPVMGKILSKQEFQEERQQTLPFSPLEREREQVRTSRSSHVDPFPQFSHQPIEQDEDISDPDTFFAGSISDAYVTQKII